MTEKLEKIFENHQIPYPGIIDCDGEIHRFSDPEDSKAKKDHWYIAHQVGPHMHVIFGSWKGGLRAHHYRSWESSGIELSAEQLAEIEQRREEAELRIEREREQATERLQRFLSEAVPCTKHAYLERKHVASYGVLEHEGSLLIPMRDASTDKIISCQKIDADGNKRFASGCKAQGGYFWIGDEQDRNPFLAEGYATAATVHAITGRACVVAFCAQNCAKVAVMLKDAKKVDTVHLLQDLGTAGEETGKRWNELRLGTVHAPKFADEAPKGADWNDLYCAEGEAAIKDQLDPPRVRPRSVLDILTAPPHPIDWVINGLIPTKSVNVIYARPGAGKSTIAYELMMALCCGCDWMQWKVEKPRQVVYVDGEIGILYATHRLRTLVDRYQSQSGNDGIIPMYVSSDEVRNEYPRGINLYDPISREFLMKGLPPGSIVVWDNLSCLSWSSGKEYIEREQAWQQCHEWMKGSGHTHVIIMHTNKAGALSGTGKILNDSEVCIRLDELKPALRYSEMNHAVFVRVEKARYSESEEKKPFGFEILPPGQQNSAGLPFLIHSLSDIDAKYREEQVDKIPSPSKYIIEPQ